jgi:hypothetical protein
VSRLIRIGLDLATASGSIANSWEAPMPLPDVTETEIVELIRQTIVYVHQQRERYLPLSAPLSPAQHKVLAPFFPSSVLGDARIVALQDEPIANPVFMSELKKRGFDLFMDMSHLNTATFVEVVVLQHTPTDRLVFHSLVHFVQYRVLGLQRALELYMRGILRTGIHVTIPLEAQAYELDRRFAEDPSAIFSVEDEVKSWAAAGRYQLGSDKT